MTRETEQLLDGVLIELLKYLRRLNREFERDDDEHRLHETLARRGYPPLRRRWHR